MVGLLTGLGLVVLMMMAALAIDLGTAQAEKRRLQDVADLAALSAAADPANALTRANATLAGNKGRPITLESLASAAYVADATLAPGRRLVTTTSSDPSANAVSVTLASSTLTPFAAIMTRDRNPKVRATATAARLGLGSFSLGSGLARIDNGILNRVLGSAFGTNVSLSLADYQTLAGFNLTAAEFLDAVALRATITSGYSDTLRSAVRMDLIVGALRDVAAKRNTQAASALSRVQLVAGTKSLALAKLIVPPSTSSDLLLGDLASAVELSALGILRASADTMNENRVVDMPGLSLGIPGVIGADAKLWTGERAQSSGWVTLGTGGVSVATAQTRLWLRIQIAPELLTGLGPSVTVLKVNVPVYIEIASAVARLTTLDCRAKDTAATMATFAPSFSGDVGGSNLARAFVGSFPGADAGVAAPFDPSLLSFAPLVDTRLSLNLGLTTVTVPLVTFEGRSNTTVGRPSVTSIAFAGNEPMPATRSFGQTGLATTLATSLLSPTNLALRTSPTSLVGIVLLPVLNLISATQNSLRTSLPAVATPLLDRAISTLAGSLGLGLGTADLTLNGVRCRLQIVK